MVIQIHFDHARLLCGVLVGDDILSIEASRDGLCNVAIVSNLQLYVENISKSIQEGLLLVENGIFQLK